MYSKGNLLTILKILKNHHKYYKNKYKKSMFLILARSCCPVAWNLRPIFSLLKRGSS